MRTAVREHQVTNVLLVPTMIQLLVDHPRVDEFHLTSIRQISYGASPRSQGVLGRAPGAAQRAATQLYGMNELPSCATGKFPADHEDPKRRRAASCALPRNEVRVVSPDDVDLPRGQVGEVVVRGGNVMLG